MVHDGRRGGGKGQPAEGRAGGGYRQNLESLVFFRLSLEFLGLDTHQVTIPLKCYLLRSDGGTNAHTRMRTRQKMRGAHCFS